MAHSHSLCVAAVAMAAALDPASTAAQAVGDTSVARPVAGDPGLRSGVVVDDEHVRVLRNYAEPGATRRMHAHKDAAHHVLTLLTGELRVTIEGQAPFELRAGDVVTLKAGVTHAFFNPGKVIATMVEVFGKLPKTQ